MNAKGGLPDEQVRFYPVVHLLTGPPGLTRNGGIWKKIKEGLQEGTERVPLMVQALHFTQYSLSENSWDEWFSTFGNQTRLSLELKSTFGENRDVFVDSGGFQLLHPEKIDLSRWGLVVSPEDILRLQLKYSPQRIASLDQPIPLSSSTTEARRLALSSIRNALWLAKECPDSNSDPVPFLVVHGRQSSELEWYTHKMAASLPRGWLREGRYGVALGSQVPLASDPDLVIQNICTVLRWMDRACPLNVPLHVFGVGDPIIGEVLRSATVSRPLSYDNSTYVQNAFRLRAFNPSVARYEDFDPLSPFVCPCHGCRGLADLGRKNVANVLSHPAYRRSLVGGVHVNRSDVLAYIALHNLSSWRSRLAQTPRRSGRWTGPNPTLGSPEPTGIYQFPLSQFSTKSERLLLLPCSKVRPYAESPSHRAVLNSLRNNGFLEGRDFDRITLSGLYGPVHWRHEKIQTIMGYDFRLGSLVSQRHSQTLRLKTANVLRVISRRYRTTVAYLRSKSYANTFGPVIEEFGGVVVPEISSIPAEFR